MLILHHCKGLDLACFQLNLGLNTKQKAAEPIFIAYSWKLSARMGEPAESGAFPGSFALPANHLK